MEDSEITHIERWKLGDSPAHNSEAEDVMEQIIDLCAKSGGKWIPVPIDDLSPAGGLYDGVYFGREEPKTPLSEALINLKIAGLVVEKIDENGKRVIEVTERFKEYYRKTLRK